MSQLTKATIISLLLIFAVTSSGCKNKHLKTLGAIVAVGIAAKVIYDMYIDYKTEQTRNDNQVIKKYEAANTELPESPKLVQYNTQIAPGAVVSPGNTVSIQSSLEVVRSKHKEQLEIQEKIVIYDNNDPTKELKSLTKVVNQDTGRCGAFKNQFTFTLPKGMPQGVYPIKTTVIVDGVEFAPVQSQMQLVELESPLEHVSEKIMTAPAI